ncbi:hypothetical protein XO10_09630 [Marinitoga sp. 1135]|uniref:SPOR domain-containing protein n=1 Tax=Marinitoga piezophila (strain DSM 14283 / JCM 11233 / KA3) TaxID=443254 RepID=H2J6P5_MARPK|nr:MULTISPECIES: hypothetical protein [Marinitoga]AEX86326.1 hypothetical protein Marpi_1948 [Marinitoga piezophila KA3]APT76726.1 hypothetical protein LN42_10325 [Marinitoga sp. 1137]NUU96503.1 hypothetical protein [Marinitoga sp. 1135]NUU98422.1 hypothetical protein [Marinitoga sp. 1138]
MIKKQKNYALIFITIMVILLPTFVALLTSYTIYLKYKIKNLELKIYELKDKDIISSNGRNKKIENNMNYELNIEEIEKFLNIKPKGIYENQKIDYFYLVKKAKSSFEDNTFGGLKLMNYEEAFRKSVSNLEFNKEYFITNIATNLYSVYSEDFSIKNKNNDNIQKVFTVQMRLYLKEEDAFFTTLTLRNAGIPVFVYKGHFKNSGKSYFAICAGLFPDITLAKNYLESIDDEKIKQLTGISVKDRFLKSFTLIGENGVQE